MGQFNAKIMAEFNPPRKWVLGRDLSYTTDDLTPEDIKALKGVGIKITKKTITVPTGFVTDLASVPRAMWWAIATLTTIGYGDVTPITGMGKLFGAIIAIIGIGTVALPSGILASGFSDQLKRRQSKYENELNKALQDGVITNKERSKLTKIEANI